MKRKFASAQIPVQVRLLRNSHVASINTLVFQDVPKEVMKEYKRIQERQQEQRNSPVEYDFQTVPKELLNTLLPFQFVGVQYVLFAHSSIFL